VLDLTLALMAAITANTLYYSLSTIAQTLAGAFALMAAFVVFKLQFTIVQIGESAKPVARAAGRFRLFRERKFQEVHDKSESAISKVSSAKPYLATSRRELGRLLTFKTRLLRRFWVSTSFTGVTLVYSVILLGLTDSVVARGCAGPVLIAAAILFMICLISYACVLDAAIRDSEPS
jgi:hypothetical protein